MKKLEELHAMTLISVADWFSKGQEIIDGIYTGSFFMTEAGWALIGVVVGSIGTGFFNLLLQRKQFNHNKEMFLLQNKATETIKNFLAEMLSHPSYTDRSFPALRAPIGGYTDDQIRQLLHEIGAKKTSRQDGSEWWYLISRQDERIAKKSSQNA